MRLRNILFILGLLSGFLQPQEVFAQNFDKKEVCTNALKTRQAIDKSTPHIYEMRDGHFYALGRIFDGGLILDFFLKDSEGKRSELLRGKEQFKKVLAHFDGKFNVIYAVWIFGDNLDQFNYFVATGDSMTDAALKTWTGQQATAAGYTAPVIKKLEGVTGSYEKVVVEFRKPEN